MAAEAVNVVFDRAGLVRKRYGANTILEGALTQIGQGGAWTLFPFLPGQTVTGGYLIVASTLSGAPSGFATIQAGAEQVLTGANDPDDLINVSCAILNGKAYLAFNSDENRLHVFHPTISATVLRRSGLETPAAATVANTGAGTYAATLRYYRVQWRTLVGGLKQRASNLGASVSFTPSGAGTHARVTRPTAVVEGETHWVVWGSADDAQYFELSTEIAIATTTYDDNEAPASYDDNDAAPDEGAFTPWPSVKFLATDGERLLGFGVWETAAGDAMDPLPGRVYISPVLDTTDYDDDERVSNTSEIQGTLDVGKNTGAVDRAICGPLNGEFLVFFNQGIVLLSPTADAVDPYVKRKLSDQIGAVTNASTFIGEDASGQPCIYFLDPLNGPYRYGANGLEWLGYDIQDVWATVNLNAANLVAHGAWYAPTKTALFWVAVTSSAARPNRILVFDARIAQRTESQGVRYGWSVWTGALAEVYGSAVFASSLMTATTNETPAIYVATGIGGAGQIVLYRTGLIDLPAYTPSSQTADGSTDFQGYVTSRVFEPDPSHFNTRLTESYLYGRATSDVEITQTLARNYGDRPDATSRVTLTATHVQTRILKKFEDSVLADAHAIQVTLGDAAAVSNNWTLDQWRATLVKDDQR
jgi:hypothetical protein